MAGKEESVLPVVDLATGEVVRDTGRSFAELVAIVDRDIDTVRGVGVVLSEIRYRWRIFKREAGYDDFDTFCRQRWGFSRQRADQLISASEVSSLDDKNATKVADLSSIKNERQARELARVEPERRQEILHATTALHGDDITAEKIREVATALPANIVDAAYAITDEAGKGELDRLQYRVQLFRSLKRAAELLAYQPEHVAAALGNDEKKTEINSLVRLLDKWSKEIDTHQGQGLRLVGGE
jgi:hypothetical protein